MNRTFGIVNIVAVLFFASLIIGLLKYADKEKNEIEQLKLSYAIDYATDAGSMAMLKTGRLNMDYTDTKSVTVDPNLALDTFLDVFCFNYDLQPTAANKALIKDYIPVAAVAGFDGYYLASPQLVSNGGGNYPDNYSAGAAGEDVDWDVVFGMKLPYTYTFGSTSYALNMGLEYTLALNGSDLVKQPGLPPTAAGPMSKMQARNHITTLVSNDMASTINRINANNPNWHHAFYIPSQLTTFSGVNSIEGPSFLVLLQNLTLSTAKPISGFSVSGSRIDSTRMLVGYRRNLTKYYAYADEAPPTSIMDNQAIEKVFETPKEAALDQYNYDFNYITQNK
ncbi:hypothetical protein B5M42_000835 [Paenibacillus athensensis]|uniref:Uncharacterized protein n=1 Tax=Paenibacillus athensensis TaxID=1967502 RepID=A0A4Y8Q749_9BACL|nr:hypothetical protein [Paenibacillus athensensis]MCD1257380.1 hypothetical protein [Paenibacillus athensensis]